MAGLSFEDRQRQRAQRPRLSEQHGKSSGEEGERVFQGWKEGHPGWRGEQGRGWSPTAPSRGWWAPRVETASPHRACAPPPPRLKERLPVPSPPPALAPVPLWL